MLYRENQEFRNSKNEYRIPAMPTSHALAAVDYCCASVMLLQYMSRQVGVLVRFELQLRLSSASSTASPFHIRQDHLRSRPSPSRRALPLRAYADDVRRGRERDIVVATEY